MQSYYKVAQKRFTDNIYLQVVDYHLLTGENSPFRLLTVDWILELDIDKLEAIASEGLAIRSRREALEKKKLDLEAASRCVRL